MRCKLLALLLLVTFVQTQAFPRSKREGDGSDIVYGPCKNTYDQCPAWRGIGWCTDAQYKDYMASVCPVTCEFCKESDGGEKVHNSVEEDHEERKQTETYAMLQKQYEEQIAAYYNSVQQPDDQQKQQQQQQQQEAVAPAVPFESYPSSSNAALLPPVADSAPVASTVPAGGSASAIGPPPPDMSFFAKQTPDQVSSAQPSTGPLIQSPFWPNPYNPLNDSQASPGDNPSSTQSSGRSSSTQSARLRKPSAEDKGKVEETATNEQGQSASKHLDKALAVAKLEKSVKLGKGSSKSEGKPEVKQNHNSNLSESVKVVNNLGKVQRYRSKAKDRLVKIYNATGAEATNTDTKTVSGKGSTSHSLAKARIGLAKQNFIPPVVHRQQTAPRDDPVELDDEDNGESDEDESGDGSEGELEDALAKDLQELSMFTGMNFDDEDDNNEILNPKESKLLEVRLGTHGKEIEELLPLQIADRRDSFAMPNGVRTEPSSSNLESIFGQHDHATRKTLNAQGSTRKSDAIENNSSLVEEPSLQNLISSDAADLKEKVQLSNVSNSDKLLLQRNGILVNSQPLRDGRPATSQLDVQRNMIEQSRMDGKQFVVNQLLSGRNKIVTVDHQDVKLSKTSNESQQANLRRTFSIENASPVRQRSSVPLDFKPQEVDKQNKLDNALPLKRNILRVPAQQAEVLAHDSSPVQNIALARNYTESVADRSNIPKNSTNQSQDSRWPTERQFEDLRKKRNQISTNAWGFEPRSQRSRVESPPNSEAISVQASLMRSLLNSSSDDTSVDTPYDDKFIKVNKENYLVSSAKVSNARRDEVEAAVRRSAAVPGTLLSSASEFETGSGIESGESDDESSLEDGGKTLLEKLRRKGVLKAIAVSHLKKKAERAPQKSYVSKTIDDREAEEERDEEVNNKRVLNNTADEDSEPSDDETMSIMADASQTTAEEKKAKAMAEKLMPSVLYPKLKKAERENLSDEGDDDEEDTDDGPRKAPKKIKLNKSASKKVLMSVVLRQNYDKDYEKINSPKFQMLSGNVKKDIERALSGCKVSDFKFAEATIEGNPPQKGKTKVTFAFEGDASKLKEIIESGNVNGLSVVKNSLEEESED